MQTTEHQIVQTQLRTLFSEVLHVGLPAADTDLFDTGILDSQRFVELLLHIEQNFNTQIDLQDFEIENFRCIEKIASLILQYKNRTRDTLVATAESHDLQARR